MNLNNLVLPDLLIADLYKNNLVQVADEITAEVKAQAAAPDAEPAEIAFLGKHLKKITVFVRYKADVHLPEKQLNFLANVLKACNLTIADIAIVNLGKQELSLQKLSAALVPSKMIFFDTEPMDIKLDLEVPEFSIKNTSDLSILKAPALEMLNQNNDQGKLLKSKLWLCLKEFFSV